MTVSSPTLVNDFAPLTDLRASAAYRQRVAGALLERFWLETRADAPLAPSSLNVRACKVSP
jgi:xanthine dehydrogenase small subunit